MGSRTHDYYCTECRSHYSPFDFERCPCGADPAKSFYDLNLEAEEPAPDGRPNWQVWLEQGAVSRG